MLRTTTEKYRGTAATRGQRRAGGWGLALGTFVLGLGVTCHLGALEVNATQMPTPGASLTPGVALSQSATPMATGREAQAVPTAALVPVSPSAAMVSTATMSVAPTPETGVKPESSNAMASDQREYAGATATQSGESGSWDPGRLMVGAGWPYVGVRYNFWGPLDVEAKWAAGDGEYAYGARLYGKVAHWGIADVIAGGEFGGLVFSGVDTLDGNGYYGEPFAGVQIPFLKRWAFVVDAGPAWYSVHANEGNSLSEQQWILNTAVYLGLF
jgi:hypothetical protein